MIKLKLKPRHRIVRKVRSAGRIYDTTRDFCSGCRCLYIKKINIPHLVNVLHKLCTTKRTGTGCPVRPLIISVLLLLWTLAACRGLWRGRYVGLYSSLYSSDWTCFCFPGTLSHMNNSKCSKHFFCFTASPLEGKAEFYPVALVSSSADRGDVEEQGGGGRNHKCWVTVPDPTAHLCFFSFLHECVLPVDEGDQDGSLYFPLSRCCFACVFLPCCLLLFFGFVVVVVFSVRVP